MKTITHSELESALLNVKGNAIITASVVTPVKLVAGNPFGSVSQHQSLNGQVGFKYINAVNNAERKAGVDEEDMVEKAEPLAWGYLSNNRAVKYHTPKGETELKKYVHLRVLHKVHLVENKYFDAHGNEISEADVKEWKYKNKKSSTQSNLPADVEVIVRDVKFENIKKVAINGETFNVVEG